MRGYRAQEQQAEYDRLDRHAAALVDYLFRGTPAEIREAFHAGLTASRARSHSVALPGLRQAVGDLLEMTRDFTVDELAVADQYLRDRGAVTLSTMRHEVWGEIPHILKSGRIQSRAQYDLLRERLNQGDDYSWSASDRVRAGELVAAYEAAQP